MWKKFKKYMKVGKNHGGEQIFAFRWMSNLEEKCATSVITNNVPILFNIFKRCKQPLLLRIKNIYCIFFVVCQMKWYAPFHFVNGTIHGNEIFGKL